MGSHATLENDRKYDYKTRGGEHGLSRLRDGVSNGQGEGHRSPETREEEHVLVVHRYLGLPTEVQEKRQRVNAHRPAQHCGKLSANFILLSGG